MTTPLYGIVVDITDPKKLGRIKIQIIGRTEGLDKELLPWYLPEAGFNTLDLPPVNEIVEIQLLDDDIFFGYWRRLNRSETMLNLESGDYPSAKILLHQDLATYGDEGIIDISYIKSIGLRVMFRESKLLIRPDKSIAAYNADKNWWVDISPESISLGSETKSAEPGVLGDKNHDSLDMLNDTIKAMAEIIDKRCIELAAKAMTNPYTSILASTFTSLAKDLKAQIETAKHSANNEYFPKTLSKVVTLD